MLALVFAALLLPAASTWTVDDDGPADFTQVSDAISKVAAGDVLLVEPGSYAGFVLTKRLTIVGRAGGERPHVEDLSTVSASTFTLAGLDFDVLAVSQVSGRGRIDDCRFGHVADAGTQYALYVDDCAEMVLSRIQVMGSKDYSQSHPTAGGSALHVTTSNVTLVDALLEGAKGFDASGEGNGGAGGRGLVISGGSRVTAAAPLIVGGPEGWGRGFFGCQDGPSGAGLDVTGSTVVLRGEPGQHWVMAGWVDGICTNFKGPDIAVTGGTVVVSGVGFDPANVFVSGGALVQPAVLEPYLTIDGTDAPGGHRDITLHGPAGAPCVLAVSLTPAHATLGAFDDALWVGLSGFHLLLPLVTQGQATPLVLTWPVPRSTAALVGASIELQPFFPGLPSMLVPGKSIAGNVAELIVRF